MALSRVYRIDSTHIGFSVGVIPLKVNGEWVVRAIPTAISLLVTGGAGSGPVDATGAGANGGAASAATKYFIYAYDDAGTTRGTLSATGHATDTTYGAEIKSGDATRTFLGMCYLGAGPVVVDTAAQRFLVSWFDKKRLHGRNVFSTNRTSTATAHTEVNTEIRVEFLAWADEAVAVAYAGPVSNDTTNGISYTSIAVDSTGTPTTVVWGQIATANWSTNASQGFSKTLSEGYHYVTILAAVSAGQTSTYYSTASELTVALRG